MDQASELDDLREQVRVLRQALRYSTAYLGAAVANGHLEECAIPASVALRRLGPLAQATPEELRTFLDRQAALEQAGRAVLVEDVARQAFAAVKGGGPVGDALDALARADSATKVAAERLRVLGFDREGDTSGQG